MTSPRRRRALRSRSQRISMGTGDLCACFWLNLSRRSGCSHCAESTARSTGRSAAREMSVSPGRLGFGPCVGWLNGTAGVDRRDEGAFGSGSVRGRIDKCRYIRSLYLIRHARERVHKENPWMSDRVFVMVFVSAFFLLCGISPFVKRRPSSMETRARFP